MASRPLTIQLSLNGDVSWLECPGCGSSDFQPVGVDVKPWNTPLVQGIDLLLGDVETHAASTADGSPTIDVTMGCLQCGAGLALHIMGGPGGTGIALSTDSEDE
jgi:hypothetical protein